MVATKTVSRASSLMAMELTAGLLLAALCKLIYDLFNGYATVPSLLTDLGFFPSAIFLDALQFFCLAAAAFLAGKALLKGIPDVPGRIAAVIAIPWVALCIWGAVSGALGEHGKVLLELARSSYLLLAAPLLMPQAVPFGL